MKKIIGILAVMGLSFACQQVELPVEQEHVSGPEFTAQAETFGAQTKTAMDGNSVVWNAGDQIAIFQGLSTADKYQVKEDGVGKTSATFGIVANGDGSGAAELPTNVAIYPYESDLVCASVTAENGAVTSYQISGVTIQSTQTYTANSFADDSFIMTALTNGLNDHNLKFKNVCGALKLQLKGTAKVKSIELKGNDNEPLSGEATVTIYPGVATPAINMSADASNTVTLDCGEGVQLSEDAATDFIITVPPTTFENGFTATVTCTDGGVAKIETAKPNPIQRSYIHTMPEITVEAEYEIKILAIGNSFSTDALQYLYGILKDAGYDYVKIGNLNIGGCNLKTHANHISTNNPEYTYYTNSTGTWTSTESYHPHDAFDSEDWDYITMQQVSHLSGMMNTYDDYLQTIVSVVKEHCPDAELVWHMTWAYDQTATHSGFSNYNNDQQTMYNAILEVVKTRILTDDNFSKVIPNATTIQNLRSSYLEDRLTRDGYHLSTDIGRYAAALTYAKALTGCDLTDITYTPSNSCTSSELRAIKDAVNKAVATPYEVTPSAYPQEDNVREDFASARWIKNRYINADTGGFAIGYTEGRCTVCEDYIPVKGGMTYNMTLDGEAKAIRWYAWYDSDKKYISGNGSEATDLVAPDNACYIRVTIYSDSGWYPINTQEIDENGYLTSPAASRIKLIPVTRFSGKKAFFFGDSITYGYIKNADGTASRATKGGYPGFFSEAVGLTHTNYGVSGSLFGTYNNLGRIGDKIKNRSLDCDFLFVAGGINDWQCGVSLSDFRQAVEEVCSYIDANFDGEVIFITPINHSGRVPIVEPVAEVQDYREIITEIALSHNFSVVQGGLFGFPTTDSPEAEKALMFCDNLHPTEYGYEFYANCLIEVLGENIII